MANGAFNASFNIAANGLTEIQIPHGTGHISNGESFMVIKKSIKITVDPGKPPVVAYVQQWGAARSAASLLLPVNVLGKKYYSINFTQSGSNQGTYIAKSQFQVIAVKDNTVIQITPKQNGTTGTPISVTLPLAGDMYQYQADQDLSGTLIESVASSSGGCVPIAVFSGSSNITWGSSASCNGASYDPLFQQDYPVSTWGKNFGFIPFEDYPNGNSYRVLASENNTSVFIDGTLVTTLNAGQIYPNAFTSNPVLTKNATSISADKPICVAQYSPSNVCGGGGFGDPDMVILNPIEQNISDITIFSSTQQSITRQWINVLLKTVATPSFTINGIVPTTAWVAAPTIPGYSYLRHRLPGSGSYRLKADSGFNAIAYGFSSNFESYAYSAGTNVRDLYQQIGTATGFGGASSPSVCVGSSTKFKVSLPYAADSIYWDFKGSQSPNVMLTNRPNPIVPDSIKTVNGKQVYWYSLPLQYTFNTPGIFPATITTYSQNADGCGGSEQEIDLEIEVVDKPVADFNFLTDGCVSKPVLFTENNSTAKPILSRYWSFGDLTSSSIASPTHTYPLPGPYDVKYTYINDIGCKSDTAKKTITLDPPPTANFSVAGTYCPGNTISFTDLSTPAIPTGPGYTYAWDFGDATTSNLPNPTHIYGTPGNYTVTLKVTSPSGCASTLFTYPTPVTINAKPNVNFNLPAAICFPSGTAAFTDASTPGSGTITTWAWNFGDASPITTVTAPASPNVSHTYSGTGPFNVNLTVTNTNGCTETKTQTLSNIYAEPQASFTAPADVCLGSVVNFNSSASTAPGSTVTDWDWDFGDGSPHSTAPNPTHTYATTGPFNVVLNIKSAAGCVTVTKFATHTVNVRSLPTATAAITGAASACQGGTGLSITFTGAGGAAPYTFTYSIDDGTGPVVQAPITTVTGNSRTITAPTTTAGTYRYALVNVTEGSTAGCTQAQAGFVDVIIRPIPTVTVNGNAQVCLNAPAPTITFTGNNGVAPYIFKYRINTGPTLTATTPGNSNSVTISAPTGTAGNFAYILESVTESSANACLWNYPLDNIVAIVVVKALPTATITGSAEVCLNAAAHNILFTGANGAAPYTFSYRINGGPILTVTSPASSNTVTVAVPTTTAATYTYTLVSVQEAGSCSQPQTGSVTTKVNPLPTANFTTSTPNCQTRDITFTDASVPNAGTIVTWVWDFGDGSPLVTINAPASPTVKHAFANAQPYDVKLTVTTDKGCESVTFSKTITINNNPTAAFTPPFACIADVAAKFTDNSNVTPGSIVAWDWLFNDPNANAGNPNTSTLREPTHHFTVAGPYTVRQIVTSSTGCKDTTYRTFDVNGLPNSNFTISNAGSVCANKQVDIKDATTLDYGAITKVEIFWDDLNNPTVGETDNSPVPGKLYSHIYPEFGTPATKTFRIRFVTYSGTSCVSSFSRDVTLLATPTLKFDNVAGICADVPAFTVTQAQLTNTLPGFGLFSGTGITALGLFNPASAGSGVHNIRYTYYADNGCTNFIENTIEVYPVPSVNAGPDRFVLEGGQVTLSPALGISTIPITYLWSPATYLNDATFSFPVSTPKDDITYTLTITSDKGCKDSDDVFIKVLKKPIVPNIFSPNGDGIHDTWRLPFIDTYPGASIDIYNRYGQLVFHSTGYTKEWDGKANGKDVPVGTYYYVVDPKNGRQKLAGYVDVIR